MNKHMMKFLALLLVWLGSVAGVQAAGEAAVYYIQTDQLNTPRVITDQSQAVVWKWESDGFGATPPNEQPGAAPAFVFNPRFAGQYFDRESNLHYNYFRDYDPQTGRYIQSDPIGLDGGINTYGYVEGNPVSFVDPDGLAPKPGPKHVPQNPNKKPPPEHRMPSGDRERNVGHPDGEEHSRQPKGQRGTRGSRGARGFGPLFIYDLTCAVMAAQGQSSPLCPQPEPPPDSCPSSI